MKKKEIDWKEVHAKLDLNKSKLEKGAEQSKEEIQRILKERVTALAKEIEKEEAEEKIEVIEFNLWNERFAFESKYIKEVYPLKELARIPCTPSFVLGLINVRGQIHSVIDLKRIFNLSVKEIDSQSRVIVLHYNEMDLGVIADVVLGSRLIPKSGIEPSLPTLRGIKEKYLKGITKDRLVILDAEVILESKEIIVHEEVLVEK